MTEDCKSDGETGWYVVSADNGVVAGPIADKVAAERLAEGYGPDHVVLSGAEIEPQAQSTGSKSVDQ
jgi:hypothetical protein